MNTKINYNVRNNENVKTNKPSIDYARLFAKSAGPSDIARCVKLLQDNGYKLPLYCDMIDTVGVEASTLTLPAAMQIVQTYTNVSTTHNHQIHTMDNLLDKSDLTVSDTGVSTGAGEVFKSQLGMLSKDANITLYAGATSTLLNYYTTETEKGEIRDVTAGVKYLSLIQVPQINYDGIREVIRTYVPSPTASQSKMYELFIKDQTNFIMVLDKVYGKCKGFSQISPILAEKAKVKLNKTYNYEPLGYVPASVDPQIKVDEKISFNQMWGLCVLSANFRGDGNSGRGTLTCGYYNYDQPAVYVKAVARARELMSILDKLGLKAVRLPNDKSIPPFTTTILVRNGISVIGDGGRGTLSVTSQSGFYQTSLVNYLYVYANSVSAPIMKKVSGLTYDATTKDCLNVLGSSSSINAMLTHYTPDIDAFVEANDYSLFPSLSPHACKVWIITTGGVFKFNPGEQKVRMTTAIIYRNLFPLTRRPFYAADAFNDIFVKELIVPKVVRRANNAFFSLTGVLSATPSTGFIKTSVPLASYTLVDRIKQEEDTKLLSRRQLVNQLRGMNPTVFASFLTDYMGANRSRELLESVLSQEIQHLAGTYKTLCDLANDEKPVEIMTTDLTIPQTAPPPSFLDPDDEGDDYSGLDLGGAVVANILK